MQRLTCYTSDLWFAWVGRCATSDMLQGQEGVQQLTSDMSDLWFVRIERDVAPVGQVAVIWKGAADL